MKKKKRILVLGSTGNLGRQALEVLDGREDYEMVGLTTNTSINELKAQVIRFKPKFVGISDEKIANNLVSPIKKYLGMEGMVDAIRNEEIDCVFNCLQGHCGILPTIESLRLGKELLMANKESLVAAGDIISEEAKRNGIRIIPVDSEHSAIFQCLMGERVESVEKLILTCSGGYRKSNPNPKIEDLLSNSRWKMGKKITVDSANLMNKGLEVMEAMVLFDMPIEKVDVTIHPQSIIHSMVQFSDGSIKASLGPTDMGFPIRFALDYPNRKESTQKRLDFDGLNLTFERPDQLAFPNLKLAFEAAKSWGNMPAALVCADEVAVNAYLKRRIGFQDIPKIINKSMKMQKLIKKPNLTQVFETIKAVSSYAERIIQEKGFIGEKND